MKLSTKNGINKTKIITFEMNQKDYHSMLAAVAKELYKMASQLESLESLQLGITPNRI